MGFSTGSYTPRSSVYPTVYNQLPTLFQEIYSSDRVLTSSAHANHNEWFDDFANQTMLFLLLQHTPLNFAFEHTRVSYTSEEIARYEANPIDPPHDIGARFLNSTSRPILRIIHVRRGFKMIDCLDTQYQDQKHISVPLQQERNHKIRVYTDIKPNTIHIVTSEYSWELLRKIIALIPHLHNLQLPANILEIFKLYGMSDFEAWDPAYTAWFTAQNFVAERQRKDVEHLISKINESAKRQLENIIANQRANIDSQIQTLAGKYKTLEEYNIKLLGLQNLPATDIEEFLVYVSKHPRITSYSVSGSELILNIASPYAYYDPEAMQMYYRGSTPALHSKFLKTFFLECFDEQKYELYTEARVLLNLVDMKVNPGDFSRLPKVYLPHSHIMRASCFGNNRPLIIKALGERNYIQAIEQTIAATHNLNFTDSTVIHKLITDLGELRYQDLKTIKDLSTGKFISIAEYKTQMTKEATTNETNQTNPGPEATIDPGFFDAIG